MKCVWVPIVYRYGMCYERGSDFLTIVLTMKLLLIINVYPVLVLAFTMIGTLTRINALCTMRMNWTNHDLLLFIQVVIR